MPLTVELDRSSPVPLYYQLAQAIEAAIRDGELAPGDRFENELALAKRLTLSRPTTRRAIQEIVDKGLLVRKRGVGTQVVQNPGAPPRRADQPVRRPRPRRPGADARSCSTTASGRPTKRSPRELNLAADREVVSIHRLRCANGEPLAVMINYLPVELAPEADELEEQRAVPVAAGARRAHPAGAPAHRRRGGHPMRRPGCWTRSPARRC